MWSQWTESGGTRLRLGSVSSFQLQPGLLLEYETRAEMNESALGETNLMEQPGCPGLEQLETWRSIDPIGTQDVNIFVVRNHEIPWVSPVSLICFETNPTGM